jgi:hypothetical protein
VAQWDLEVLAANLRRDSDDLSLYAGFLLNTLSAALPAQMVRVERKAGLFGRVKDDAPVLAVSVLFGDRRFTLRRSGVGHPAQAQISHESGGVVLRTDEVGMDVWSRDLAAALAGYAQRHTAAAQALQRLTLPGAPS